ncbi:MAG: hypothetical protein HZA48_02970 [Planctomycetes bacterium]|nr:hypothetical protein [Planctomycetota bacterium]
MTFAQNDYSTVARKYNSYSEVYEETSAVTVGGQTQTKTVSSEHDRIENRTALIYPSGKKLNYTRDELDRTKIMSETVGANNVSLVAQYAYNGYRIKQRKSGNGTQLDVEY